MAMSATCRPIALADLIENSDHAGGYAWIPVNDPSLLDVPRCELLLIGARVDAKGMLLRCVFHMQFSFNDLKGLLQKAHQCAGACQLLSPSALPSLLSPGANACPRSRRARRALLSPLGLYFTDIVTLGKQELCTAALVLRRWS